MQTYKSIIMRLLTAYEAGRFVDMSQILRHKLLTCTVVPCADEWHIEVW